MTIFDYCFCFMFVCGELGLLFMGFSMLYLSLKGRI